MFIHNSQFILYMMLWCQWVAGIGVSGTDMVRQVARCPDTAFGNVVILKGTQTSDWLVVTEVEVYYYEGKRY